MTDVKLCELQISTHGSALIEYDLGETIRIEEALSRLERSLPKGASPSLASAKPIGGCHVSLRKIGAKDYELTVTKLPEGPTEACHHETLEGALDDVRARVKAAEELEG